MKIAPLAVALVALAVVVGASASGRDVVFERHSVPSEYQMVAFAAPHEKVTFILALHQQNLDVLEKKFWAVSTPGSAEYQNFMTVNEILDLVAPAAEDHDVVLQYLLEQGVQESEIEDHRDALKVTVSAHVATRVFGTKFYVFQHKQRKAVRVVRALGKATLPTEVAKRVAMVTGASDFVPLHIRDRARVPAAGTEAVVPQTLYSQYNYNSQTAAGISAGVAEFQAGQDFSASDLATFAKQTNVSIPALTSSHIVNPLPPSGVEGSLDIQYIAATGIGATNWYWTEQNWLYDFATSFFQASDKPDIVSISYGWSELQQCQFTNECSILGVTSEGYVARTNTEFQKIGLNGVSLLAASGDSGANGRSDPFCQKQKLFPSFPASSPYITAVGATQLDTGCTPLQNGPPVCNGGQYSCCSGGSESAVSYTESNFASGGGFSNYAPQPDYQKSFVSTYLSSGVDLPPSSYYNATNRGFPDVAALGHNYLVYMQEQGGFFPVGGTSAASPAFAGAMARVNAVMKQKSGKPLGFLNPLLYKAAADSPTVFSDITKGDNICTERGCSGCKGFKAAAGWDPVTGLGVPNVANFINYVNQNL